jgi:hypothetical protein
MYRLEARYAFIVPDNPQRASGLQQVDKFTHEHHRRLMHMDRVKVTISLEIPNTQKLQAPRPPLRPIVVKIGPEFREYWV